LGGDDILAPVPVPHHSEEIAAAGLFHSLYIN